MKSFTQSSKKEALDGSDLKIDTGNKSFDVWFTEELDVYLTNMYQTARKSLVD